MNGSLLRQKLKYRGYYDDYLDTPLTTRLIYDVMKIVEDNPPEIINKLAETIINEIEK